MAIKPILRRAATDLITSPAGRLVALGIDVLVMAGAYLVARALGRRSEP